MPVLSTPSLGITGIPLKVSLGADYETFNSLSRDHGSTVSRTGPGWTLASFNSLSRDHRALFRDFPALRGFPPRRPFAHLYFPATI